MQLICSKCFSTDLVEKSHESIHNKAVFCSKCNSWVKWGGIESNGVPEGEHLAKVISGEEKNNKFILLFLETDTNKKIKHIFWKQKEKDKYSHVSLNSMLAGFDSNISKFTSVVQIIDFILNKNVYITVKNKEYKGKTSPEIVRWRAVRD